MGTFKFDEIAFNSTEKKKPVDKDKYTYLGLEHLDSDSIYVTRYGADVAPKGDKLIMKKGDVLFGKRRAYQKKVAIAPFDGIFSAHGMVLRPKEEVIDKDFFPMFIKSDYFLDAAIKISVGSLSPTINWRDLKDLKFELPSLEEQRKLAEVLWAIYDMKDKYKKLILATDELVKSQFIEMFGKGFETIKLCDLATFRRGSFPQPYGKPEWYDGEGAMPFVQVADVGENMRLVEDTKQKISVLAQPKSIYVSTGSVVVTLQGSIGRVAITQYDCYMDRTLAVFESFKTEVNKLCFAYQLKQKFSKEAEVARGVTIKTITKEEFSNFEIAKVPIALQNHFAEFIQQSDKSKFALQEAIKDLDALSKKIIAENLIPAGRE